MLERFEGKWSQIDRLNRLKRDGAISEEEFEAEKARLLAKGGGKGAGDPETPRGGFPASVLALSVVALVAVAGIAAAFLQSGSMTTGGYSAPYETTTTTTNMTDANMTASSASSDPPPSFTEDQVATAAATAYSGQPTETDGSGSRMAFTPARLIIIEGRTLALLSNGVRDGGMVGGAAHGTAGELRVDYLNWSGGSFELPTVRVRHDLAGSQWGEAPKWRLAKAPGLPVVVSDATASGQGCVATERTRLKLTPAGVVRIGSKVDEDCSAARAAPSDTDTTSMTANVTG